MSNLQEEIASRRTFAIISHPDAGKTTLTEKLLLYTGSIQTAGSVKGKSSSKHAVSDWMDIEKERGPNKKAIQGLHPAQYPDLHLRKQTRPRSPRSV